MSSLAGKMVLDSTYSMYKPADRMRRSQSVLLLHPGIAIVEICMCVCVGGGGGGGEELMDKRM